MQMSFVHLTPVIGGLLLFKKADVTAQRQTRETTIAVKLDPALVSPEHLGIPDLTGCFDDGPTRNEILTRRLQDIFAEGDDRFPGFALTEVDVCVGPASTMVCEHPEHDLVLQAGKQNSVPQPSKKHTTSVTAGRSRWRSTPQGSIPVGVLLPVGCFMGSASSPNLPQNRYAASSDPMSSQS